MKQTQHRSSVWNEVESYCVLRRILRNFWMVLMCAGLFVLAAYIISALMVKPKYSCTATFVVTPRSSSLVSSSSVTASTAEQFSKLLTGTTLTSQVRRIEGSDVAGASISSTAVKGTNLIQLTASGPSPRAAYYLCTGILDHYENYTQYVFDSVMLEPVSAPSVPRKTSLWVSQKRTLILAGLAGAVGMIFLLAVLSITSGTVQTVSGARNQLDGSLIVTLSHQRKRRTVKSIFRRKKTSLLISNPTTSFLYVETIHQLRTRVEHAAAKHGCRTFLVTSISENEGKSTVAANLALSLARRHKKVLLVDCDLRKSAQHLIFDETEKHVTLNSLLKGDLAPEQLVKALHYRKAENLFFLFSSNVRRHSAELLGSDQMHGLLEILRVNFDFVILDSSPMGFFTDSEVLCDAADASLLVVRQDLLVDRVINDAIDNLSRCKARFLGYVLNDFHSLNFAAGFVGGNRYGYGYGYSHSYGYAYGNSGSRRSKGYGYNYGYGSSGSKERVSSTHVPESEPSGGKED